MFACEYAAPTILRCSVGDGPPLVTTLALLLSLLLVVEPERQNGDDVLQNELFSERKSVVLMRLTHFGL